MKKIILFFFLLLFSLVTSSFAVELCGTFVYAVQGTQSTYTAYTGWSWDGSTAICAGSETKEIASDAQSLNVKYWKYDDVGGWSVYSMPIWCGVAYWSPGDGVDIGGSSVYDPNGYFPNGCDDIPVPCGDEIDALATSCGGSEFIQDFDMDTCTGTCMDCSPANYTGPLPNCDTSMATWNTSACMYVCDACEDDPEQLALQCPQGVYFYDNESCTPVCNNCSNDYQKCVTKCGIGNIFESDCNEDGTTLTSFCICNEIPIDNPDPDDTPTPDPDPDDPIPEEPDPSDDPPDGDDPVPEDLDHDLLIKITDNTDRIGDINQAEFNKLNATAKDIKNNTAQGNDFLGQIKDGINETNKNLDGIENDISDIADGTELGNGFLEKIEQNTRNNADEQKKTNEELVKITDDIEAADLSQGDIDGFVADFETMLNDTWSQKEEESNTAIMADINGTEPIVEGDMDFITVPFISLLPSSQTCTDLDLSFNDKEIIISCEMSLIIKEILSYFVYFLSMMGITLMIFRQLRPNQ